VGECSTAGRIASRRFQHEDLPIEVHRAPGERRDLRKPHPGANREPDEGPEERWEVFVDSLELVGGVEVAALGGPGKQLRPICACPACERRQGDSGPSRMLRHPGERAAHEGERLAACSRRPHRLLAFDPSRQIEQGFPIHRAGGEARRQTATVTICRARPRGDAWRQAVPDLRPTSSRRELRRRPRRIVSKRGSGPPRAGCPEVG
jgi:hypothetical protein